MMARSENESERVLTGSENELTSLLRLGGAGLAPFVLVAIILLLVCIGHQLCYMRTRAEKHHDLGLPLRNHQSEAL